MKLKVKKPFSWAHGGTRIEHFEANQVIETEDQDLIAVSLKEEWTVKARSKAVTDADADGADTEGADTADGADLPQNS
jgi:hypothetical protein